MLPKYIIAILVILSLLSVGGIITTSLFAAKVIKPNYDCVEIYNLAQEDCV